METNPLIYNLSEKIEYSKDGDFHQTATIEFNGPNMEVYDLSIELSQLVMRAIFDAQDLRERFTSQETSEQTDALTGEAMKVILFSSKNVKFSDIAATCKKIFLKVGTYDGKTKLKETTLNRLPVNDYTMMCCEYCANFIFPSLLPGGE